MFGKYAENLQEHVLPAASDNCNIDGIDLLWFCQSKFLLRHFFLLFEVNIFLYTAATDSLWVAELQLGKIFQTF